MVQQEESAAGHTTPQCEIGTLNFRLCEVFS